MVNNVHLYNIHHLQVKGIILYLRCDQNALKKLLSNISVNEQASNILENHYVIHALLLRT